MAQGQQEIEQLYDQEESAVTKNARVIPLSVTLLCVGCGNCEAVCPVDAIHSIGISKIDEKRCTAFYGRISKNGLPRCLICLRYCPVKGALVANREKS